MHICESSVVTQPLLFGSGEPASAVSPAFLTRCAPRAKPGREPNSCGGSHPDAKGSDGERGHGWEGGVATARGSTSAKHQDFIVHAVMVVLGQLTTTMPRRHNLAPPITGGCVWLQRSATDRAIVQHTGSGRLRPSSCSIPGRHVKARPRGHTQRDAPVHHALAPVRRGCLLRLCHRGPGGLAGCAARGRGTPRE